MMHVVTCETLSLQKVMQFKQIILTAVCVLLLSKVKRPKSKSLGFDGEINIVDEQYLSSGAL